MKKFLDWVLDNSTVIILYIAMFYYAVKQNREYTFAFIVLILLYLIFKTVNNIEKILKDKE